MISPALKKVFADFTTRWSRSLMTLAGLVIGISAVIGVASAFLILNDDLQENFVRTTPPNVSAVVGELTSDQVQRLAGIPGVEAVEERRAILVRLEIRPDVWFNTMLFVVEDFDDMRIATIDPETGSWPAMDGEVLIERDGRYYINTQFGEQMNFRFSDGTERALTYTGQVHDAGQPPTHMERLIYGYITRATYDSWGLDNQYTRLLMTVTDEAQALPEPQSEAASMHAAPEPDSRAQYAADHLIPVMDFMGKEFVTASVLDAENHPHKFQMVSIMALLTGLMLTAMTLCAALTINLIDSILPAEIRNIGVMKAIGGRHGQILRPYLLGMGALGGLAAMIGLSFALNFGRGLADIAARMINFNILTETDPIWLAPSMVALGMVIPVLLTWWRVDQAIRKPVRVALQNDAHLQTGSSQLHFTRTIGWIPLVPRMALRNLFRSPRRTGLTVMMVVVGIISFLMAANIRSSLLDTVDAVDRTQLASVVARTRTPVDTDAMDQWLTRYDEIESVEYWTTRMSEMLEIGESVGRNQAINFVPEDMAILVPDMMEGEWLSADRQSGIVISTLMHIDEGMEVGDVMDIKVGGERTSVTVIGVVKEFGGGAVYGTEALASTLGLDTEASNAILIRLRDRSMLTQIRFGRALETAMLAADWSVFAVSTNSDLEAVISGHLDIIARALEVVAVVMLAVCALGLASSTSVSVIERTREIGVLKAIGGRGGAIRGIFLWEAVFVALIGWGIATVLAPIPSEIVSTNFGIVMVQYPFNYKAEIWSIPMAACIALIIAILASILPAQAAARHSVREAIQSV
jgi:putative ABC transport system permease protein